MLAFLFLWCRQTPTMSSCHAQDTLKRPWTGWRSDYFLTNGIMKNWLNTKLHHLHQKNKDGFAADNAFIHTNSLSIVVAFVFHNFLLCVIKSKHVDKYSHLCTQVPKHILRTLKHCIMKKAEYYLLGGRTGI